MRKLSEIVDDCIENKMPTHEECYYALQVYRRMLNMDHQNVRKLALTQQNDFYKKEIAELSFSMYKGALAMPPKAWLGQD